MAIYEAALNRHTEALAAGLVAQMSQSQALLRMQELNYDLLLGGDLTSPTIADWNSTTAIGIWQRRINGSKT